MEPRIPEITATDPPSAGPDTTAMDRLPIDSDPEQVVADDADAGTLGEVSAHRPVHLHPGFVLVVITGGVVGALARYGLSIVLPAPGGWPLPTLIINLAGAFLLGVLLEALVRRGPDTGRLRVIRLLAGTGFMGAFTTYSTLALETNTLLGSGRTTDALIYVAASLLGGTVATVAGIRAAAGHHTRMTTRRRDATLRPDRQEGHQ
ncbi:CrcB protein [Arthrobacter oryzae]|jgi:CrcB protein|uniref:fluoride efflux transporter FluC n=1 Tax=Micrococcaceae TaxID=1268 RepID=UPI001F35957E|nr:MULTISPECIES: CrcB family protein [Micrococcaceae]MCW3768550.1 CrcB family protein [Paenarthrobacter sp. PAE-2]MDP9989467.1 CrcB protein [Arthrobacter oryzae]UKA71368.1 CrcB family protein [Arthrobacter sp. FW306-06-A]